MKRPVPTGRYTGISEAGDNISGGTAIAAPPSDGAPRRTV